MICVLSGLWFFVSAIGIVRDCGDSALRTAQVVPSDDPYESQTNMAGGGNNRGRRKSGAGPSYLDPQENNDSDTASYKFKVCFIIPFIFPK